MFSNRFTCRLFRCLLSNIPVLHAQSRHWPERGRYQREVTEVDRLRQIRAVTEADTKGK